MKFYDFALRQAGKYGVWLYVKVDLIDVGMERIAIVCVYHRVVVAILSYDCLCQFSHTVLYSQSYVYV